jgi:cellulose synthase operon protein C
MILKFPNISTLRLALTSGVVPPAVALVPASAGYDEQESLWVETAANLSRSTQNELKKLGVQVARASGSTAIADVSCWPELLPLQVDSGRVDRPEQTPYLFDLASGEELSHFVSEMLRLGNDRQSYRWLDPSPPTPLPSGERSEEPRVLLRVIGPPYYTLLRVLDRNGNEAGPRAFLERAPRVWVELGWTHPLVEHLKPAAGQLLFLQPPGRWTTIDEQPFHDIYDVLEFPLPNIPSRYQEGQLPAKITVTPTLKKGGSTDNEEMWVVTDNPLETVNEFVQNEDEKRLQRLLFAVGEKDGKLTIVLRARPSKLPPLDLKLKAQGYRPFSKMPNLFLPVGTYLHPKLRRDMVRNLFAEDPNILTWLARNDDGSCVPHCLAENAFRPLSEWVEYVLDHDRQPLQAWVQAAQFEFESFICDDEEQDKPKKPPSDRVRDRKKGRDGGDEAAGDAALFEYVDKSRKPDEPAPALDAFSAIPTATPNELQVQLRAVEEKFMALPGGLDTPERQQLWRELAGLNMALGDAENAGICWINALWNQDQVPAGWKWNWFRAEAAAVPNFSERGLPHNRSWVTAITLASEKTGEVSGDDLDRLFALEEPKQTDVRALAAYVVWASGRTPVSAALVARLQPVQHFLEKNEQRLPVRAAWLAWSHLVQLARGDVLALARTRDRLLERLFHNGLRPEMDMPNFLRFAGQPGGTRFRGVREWFLKMYNLARKWSELAENQGVEKTQTAVYIDLLFAFGLARLGEHDPSRELLNNAREALAGGSNQSHLFLFNAFEYRIKQALDGRPANGALPPHMMEELEEMERMERYVVDRMRERSRILEPDTTLNPYRHWAARMNDLETSLVELADIFDRQEVSERVARLWAEQKKSASGNENRAKILQKSLEIAPRISEEFGRDLLEKVTAVFDALPKAPDVSTFIERAKLLERALFVAAHFDRLEHIQPLIERFRALLEAQDAERAVSAIDELAGRCLRGLRKLGMRDEIDHLLTMMAKLVLGGQELKALTAKATARPAELRALLHVASGWFYFGRNTQAEPVMQAARSLLMQKQLDPKEKTALAAVYAATLGQAPRETAQKRLEELFTHVEGVKDTFTTAKYYYRSQLDVVEAVVLAVVSDDFTMGVQARRWLDDDEFVVRRRIHRDLKALMAHG